MGANKAALILMKNSHFDRTLRYVKKAHFCQSVFFSIETNGNSCIFGYEIIVAVLQDKLLNLFLRSLNVGWFRERRISPPDNLDPALGFLQYS